MRLLKAVYSVMCNSILGSIGAFNLDGFLLDTNVSQFRIPCKIQSILAFWVPRAKKVKDVFLFTKDVVGRCLFCTSQNQGAPILGSGKPTFFEHLNDVASNHLVPSPLCIRLKPSPGRCIMSSTVCGLKRDFISSRSPGQWQP